MGLFKAKKNKKFNYSPRYYQNEKGGNPFEITNRFDKFRKATSAENSGNLKQKFSLAMDDLKNNPDNKANKIVIIIALILIFIFLALIGFDLTIFTQ